MKDLRSLLTAAASKTKNSVRINTSMEDRKDLLIKNIKALDSSATVLDPTNEKPARGGAFYVIEMSDRFRINYRCGYGRHNYAPVIEVLK